MRKNIMKLLSGLVLVALLGIGCSVNKKIVSTPKEKADFSFTAEEYDRIFTDKGATDKDLEKYAGKNIAVSGKVEMVVTKKTDKEDPKVKLYAPAPGFGVICFFDEKDLDQLKELKKDGMAKVQGFQNERPVAGLPPMLKHCQVLEIY